MLFGVRFEFFVSVTEYFVKYHVYGSHVIRVSQTRGRQFETEAGTGTADVVVAGVAGRSRSRIEDRRALKDVLKSTPCTHCLHGARERKNCIHTRVQLIGWSKMCAIDSFQKRTSFTGVSLYVFYTLSENIPARGLRYARAELCCRKRVRSISTRLEWCKSLAVTICIKRMTIAECSNCICKDRPRLLQLQ